MIKNILFAHDGTNVSDKALAYVKAFALKFSSQIKILHIYSSPAFVPNMEFGQIVPIFSSDMEEVFRQKGKDVILEVEKEFMDMGIAVESELIRSESIGSIIIEAAKQGTFDLLVIGKHSRSGLESFLIGSTSEHIIHEVRCPVLIIPE